MLADCTQVVGGGRDSRPVIVQFFEPRHMVLAKFEHLQGFSAGFARMFTALLLRGGGEGKTGGKFHPFPTPPPESALI